MIELDKGPHVKWAESMAEMLLEKKNGRTVVENYLEMSHSILHLWKTPFLRLANKDNLMLLN